MAITKEAAELVKNLTSAFFPIVMKDKDIQEFFEDNKLDEDDQKLCTTWFACTSAGLFFASQNREDFQEMAKYAQYNSNQIEAELAQKYEDIHDVLVGVLKENVDEWLEIVSDMLSENNQKQEEAPAKRKLNSRGGKSSNDDGVDQNNFLLKLCGILSTIIVREDDAIELIEKYNEIEKERLVFFICLIVLYTFISHAEESGDTNESVEQMCSQLKQSVEANINEQFNFLKNNVDDFNQFNEDVKELNDDHNHEFIKKMFKKIAKQSQQ